MRLDYRLYETTLKMDNSSKKDQIILGRINFDQTNKIDYIIIWN